MKKRNDVTEGLPLRGGDEVMEKRNDVTDGLSLRGGGGIRKRRNGITYGLLILSGVLLLGSAVGSTRAALTYYSENYTAEITISQIGVSLMENGTVVSSRDYDNDKWNVSTNSKSSTSTSGTLLANMLKKDEKLSLNKKYDEVLKVKNSGSIDEYVRVRIYRYWMDESGKKITTLSPELIDLNLVNTGQWVKGEGTRECTELYYKGILTAGSESAAFADTIRIDGQVATEATVETNGNVITTTYKYDGAIFHLDVEVDAVQTHNARDANRSSWGVDAAALGIL